MNEESMREQFEAYATAIGLSVVRTSKALAFANGSRREAGDYIMLEALAAWWAWRVSRQVLEVDLPSPAVDYSYRDSEVTGACKYHEFAVKAIEAAGVRRKA